MKKTVSIPESQRTTLWAQRLRKCQEQLSPARLTVEGRLTRMVGLTLEASGCQAAIGELCNIVAPNTDAHRAGSAHGPGVNIEAEVVGFSGDRLYLMPTGEIRGLVPNARVIPTGRAYEARVGGDLLGRIIDGSGRPLDGKGRIHAEARLPLAGRSVNPLERDPIRMPLDVGVRSINSLLSVGRGQRLGLFAGSGVGKSVLLGMMTKFTNADVVVVGLIGERGREVKEFIDNILGSKGMARAVVVAAPADSTPVMRLHGAAMATTIAEYYRDQGKHVLLLMDSLTRFAQAQREIALAIGEPPATKGYPPSVFAKIPQLVERAGNGAAGKGSITAFYTVLVEGDDQQDPIADAARAILDGHIVLSRALAESGVYPAVDIESSISRVMTEVVDETHLRAARLFKAQYSLYQQNRDLINVGAYTRGSNPELDAAIAAQPRLVKFLQQNMNQAVTLIDSKKSLLNLYSTPAKPVAETKKAMSPPPLRLS